MDVTLLPLTIRVWQDRSTKARPYLAYSPDFKITAGGKDAASAKKTLLSLVEDIVVEEEKEGTLHSFLQEMGFSHNKRTAQWEAPELSFVQVPLKVTHA